MAAARKKLTSAGGIKNCIWQIYHSSCLSEFSRGKRAENSALQDLLSKKRIFHQSAKSRFFICQNLEKKCALLQYTARTETVRTASAQRFGASDTELQFALQTVAARTRSKNYRFIGGIMALIGKEVSDFVANAFFEDKFITVSKKDLIGKWSVLFFYPADFTFVCPTELEDLADTYEEFKKIGCEVYSVSTDSHFVHKAWKDTSKTIKKIKYPMIADPTHVLSKDFDVLIESSGMAERGTFILNPEGKVVGYEVVAGNIGRNADELLRRVKALQYVAKFGDQACPAKWQPGKQALKPSIELVGAI